MLEKLILNQLVKTQNYAIENSQDMSGNIFLESNTHFRLRKRGQIIVIIIIISKSLKNFCHRVFPLIIELFLSIEHWYWTFYPQVETPGNSSLFHWRVLKKLKMSGDSVLLVWILNKVFSEKYWWKHLFLALLLWLTIAKAHISQKNVNRGTIDILLLLLNETLARGFQKFPGWNL